MQLGAVMGEKNGWDASIILMREKRGRRAGADQRKTGWLTLPFYEQTGEEHTRGAGTCGAVGYDVVRQNRRARRMRWRF